MHVIPWSRDGRMLIVTEDVLQGFTGTLTTRLPTEISTTCFYVTVEADKIVLLRMYATNTKVARNALGTHIDYTGLAKRHVRLKLFTLSRTPRMCAILVLLQA